MIRAQRTLPDAGIGNQKPSGAALPRSVSRRYNAPVESKLHRLLSAIAFCCVASAAQAAGYDDFTRGVAANAQDDSNEAVVAFSAAIAAGDLSPALLPSAYRARAVAYLRLKKCAEAVPDLAKAIELKAAYPDVRWLHSQAEECLGRHDAAMADMTALIAAKPDAYAYFTRGRMRWYLADYAGAVVDLVQARELNRQDAYIVLWLEMARQRSGTLDATVAAADLAALRTEAWPRSIVELYAGARNPEDGLTARRAQPATDTDTQSDDGNQGMDDSQENAAALPNRQCESDFYLGEYWLGRRDLAAAKPLLQHAADACAPQTVERDAAHNELGRLK